MTRRAQWMVLAVAALLGAAYAAATPPFEVPDEVFHFWRPMILAGGQFMPQRRGEPDAGVVPVGVKTLVYVLSFHTPEGKYTAKQMREAAAIPLETATPKPIRFLSSYTPVPYLPQTIVAVAARQFEIRPLIAFYLGRAANLICALALIALAMRIAPALAAPIAAAALLPATLSEFASWSADPLTIALAVLLTSMLLAQRVSPAAAAVALLLALCKPAYFLIALLVLAARARPATKAAVIASSAAGTLLALAYNSLAAYNQRMGVPIDARAQLACILAAPLHFAGTLARDLAAHGWTYLAQMTGRFGSVLQVGTPAAMIWAEIALLAFVALCAGVEVRGAFRAGAALVVAATIGGIFLATFLFNSIACGDAVEGVQGRYFLPLLPLALTVPALRRARRGVAPVIVAAAVSCNAVALLAIARHFWW
jgi:uncharacterized membrane protein